MGREAYKIADEPKGIARMGIARNMVLRSLQQVVKLMELLVKLMRCAALLSLFCATFDRRVSLFIGFLSLYITRGLLCVTEGVTTAGNLFSSLLSRVFNFKMITFFFPNVSG